MIKLIVSDLDGTLLNDDGKVSKENIKAITDLSKFGIQFLICSGRAYWEIGDIIDDCGIKNTAICLNGSDMRDENGNSILNHYLKNDYVDLIYQLSCEQKCACLYHCLDRTYLTISRKELELYFIQYVMEKDHLTTFEAKEKYKRYYIYNYGRCDKYIDDIKKKKVVKAEFVFLNNYQYDRIFDYLSKFDLNVANGYEEINNLEITDSKASKGSMLMEYCKLNNYQKNEVMVIGDSFNDLSMFDMFEYSAAVMNAPDEVKQHARYITSSNNDHGVAEILKKIMLGAI